MRGDTGLLLTGHKYLHLPFERDSTGEHAWLRCLRMKNLRRRAIIKLGLDASGIFLKTIRSASSHYIVRRDAEEVLSTSLERRIS